MRLGDTEAPGAGAILDAWGGGGGRAAEKPRPGGGLEESITLCKMMYPS